MSTDIRLILSRHNSHQRRPVVAILGSGGVACAAVIFLERCVFGMGIGLLRAGDPAGDGAVIAPASERKEALLAGIDAVLRQWRCHTAAASLSGTACACDDLPARQGRMGESACRIVRRELELSATFEETLRLRFTPRKRKNLLYYRRKLFASHAAEFVPEIPVEKMEAALLELSAHSWPARTAAEVALHCEFLRRHPECFGMGLRLEAGAWLSIVTGWRMGGVTYMPWQLNHDGYKDASLMQVMRTCLIEHEISLGQRAVSWIGGTVSFQTACREETCLDVLASRRGVRNSLMRRVVVPILYRKEPDEFEAGSLMLLVPRRQDNAKRELSETAEKPAYIEMSEPAGPRIGRRPEDRQPT